MMTTLPWALGLRESAATCLMAGIPSGSAVGADANCRPIACRRCCAVPDMLPSFTVVNGTSGDEVDTSSPVLCFAFTEQD